MKGVILEELVLKFNFVAITMEDIVLSYLPNKVANMVETAQEIQDLIRVSFLVLSKSDFMVGLACCFMVGLAC